MRGNYFVTDRKSKDVSVTTSITRELYNRFEEACRRERTTKSEKVRHMIEQYIRGQQDGGGA